jgi:ABC-type Fe3+/spermidine/putrescine transport system ATPase subunit
VEELYLEPSRLEIAEYLGPVNRIPGVRSGNRIETPVGSFVPQNGGEGVKEQGWVLFRPEHLSLCPLVSEDGPANAFGYCDEFGGGSCCLRGTVTESKVCGDYRRVVVSLACAGSSATPRDTHLLIVHSRLEERYQVGDRVMIAAPLSRMGWANG